MPNSILDVFMTFLKKSGLITRFSLNFISLLKWCSDGVEFQFYIFFCLIDFLDLILRFEQKFISQKSKFLNENLNTILSLLVLINEKIFQFVIKLYSKDLLKVLQIYHFRCIYYPLEESITKSNEKIGTLHVIDFSEASDPFATDPDSSESMDFELFDLMVDLFDQVFLGDTLSAKFAVCSLLSKVYLRRDALVLGNFPLHVNVKDVPFDISKYVQELISQLMPTVKVLELSIKNLNKAPFIPTKDYERDMLVHSGK